MEKWQPLSSELETHIPSLLFSVLLVLLLPGEPGEACLPVRACTHTHRHMHTRAHMREEAVSRAERVTVF